MSEFAFLPVNLDRNAARQGRELGLVRVDEERRPQLLRHAWRYQKRTGRVERAQSGFDWTSGASKVFRPLQYVVLSVTQGSPIHFANGDFLDFRRSNLLPGRSPSGAAGHLCGTTFGLSAEHPEALRELHENLAYYRAEAKSSCSRFSVAVTKEILEYVRKECSQLPADAVRAQVSLVWNKGEELSSALFTQLLSGRTNVVPGYDYAALKKTRPAAGRPFAS